MVADQLRRRQVNAAMPRRDHEAAEQRWGGGAARADRKVQHRRVVGRQGHGRHPLIGGKGRIVMALTGLRPVRRAQPLCAGKAAGSAANT